MSLFGRLHRNPSQRSRQQFVWLRVEMKPWISHLLFRHSCHFSLARRVARVVQAISMYGPAIEQHNKSAAACMPVPLYSEIPQNSPLIKSENLAQKSRRRKLEDFTCLSKAAARFWGFLSCSDIDMWNRLRERVLITAKVGFESHFFYAYCTTRYVWAPIAEVLLETRCNMRNTSLRQYRSRFETKKNLQSQVYLSRHVKEIDKKMSINSYAMCTGEREFSEYRCQVWCFICFLRLARHVDTNTIYSFITLPSLEWGAPCIHESACA
jgi:hypothetical protein